MHVPKSVLITGANRGIGLGLVHAYLGLDGVQHVFATARDLPSAKELKSLSDPRLHLVQMDVQKDETIKAAAQQVEKVVGADGLNLLINNAGIWEAYPMDATPNRDIVNRVLDVNGTSQLIVTQYFLPLLRNAASSEDWGVHRAAIIMMSSGAASIVDNGSGSRNGNLAYRLSKAALNQLMKTLAVDLSKEGILVASVAPGHVLTDMGGKSAEITSCSEMVATFSKWEKQHTGGFFRRNGDPFPF
ncbi:unnamed protein product, partial [Mesorhabditis spiculigera]